MRISFLHLSDFHLNDSKGIHPAKIQAIVDSLGVYAPFEGIVIVLSGDIAATGQTNQYKIAATLLKRLVPQLKIKYSLNQKNIKILIEEEENDTLIETLDIYDYDETQIDELNNQLIRAFLQLKIIARNFSAFISILPGPAKKDYVSAMYQLPNKIFHQWSESIDNSIDHLVEEIIAWQESPGFEGKKLSREDILRFFQEVSFNMLLNLYNVASSHGANDNTVDYLAQQDYITSSLNYRIERLMFWEKVDDYQAVIKEAEDLCETHDDGMVKNMALAILRHMLVHSDKIIDRERRRISSKYFSPRAQTKILMDRQKSQKERGI